MHLESHLRKCKNYNQRFRRKDLFKQHQLSCIDINNDFFFFLFTPCKAEHPLRGMELEEKETQKD